MSRTFPTPPTFVEPIEEDRTTGKTTFNPIWLKWFFDAAEFFTALGGGVATSHNGLSGLQGGVASEYYHLTLADFTALTGQSAIVLRDTQAPPHYWRVTVDNTGTLQTADIGTTFP